MIMICIAIGVIAIVIVLLPFKLSGPGFLAPASAEASVEKLEQMRTIILEQFLREEGNARKGLLTSKTWAKRQIFLSNRYIDFTKQLDHVRYLAELEKAAAAAEEGE